MQEQEISIGSGILLVEPFYGGSHKQLVDLLEKNFVDCSVFTLPAKKWHWRARTAALYFSQAIPCCTSYRVLFCSSVLNLCELVALRPDLARLKKVLYFHENQLAYPVRKDQDRDFQYGYNQVLSWPDLARLKKVLYFHENQLAYPVRKDQDRDFQYGYNQVLSCLVSDVVVFNSHFNMESFLSAIPSHMKKIPDHRPKNLDELIRPKCVVLSYPVQFPDVTRLLPQHKLLKPRPVVTCPSDHSSCRDEDRLMQSRCEEDPPQSSCAVQQPACGEPLSDQEKPLHIVWPHRWEHDKNPELFFNTLLKLKEQELPFQVSVLGETFTDVPDVFSSSRRLLDSQVLNWGFLSSKDDYLRVLCDADVVVSTSNHEFFGVSMLEAVHCGCFPLCPKALVYPEIFPVQYLYSTPEQLYKRLRELCKRPGIARRHVVTVDTSKFSWTSLKSQFLALLTDGCA